MNVGSLGIRSGSNGSLQHLQNGKLQSQASFVSRKPSKMSLSGSREKERILPFICRYLGRGKVGMLILFVFAFLAFISGFSTINRATPGSASSSSEQDIPDRRPFLGQNIVHINQGDNVSSLPNTVESMAQKPPSLPSPFPPHTSGHPCDNFAFPPPPPADRRRIGPRPCPVCYLPVDQAIASMPRLASESPVLHSLNYVRDENPTKIEPHGGSDFGGYPLLKQRNDSFDIKEAMTVHCGFVKGTKPGWNSGFDIDEAELTELEQPHDVIVASAIFGNYDVIQQPKNIGEIARKNVPFYMFVDEETEAYMKNSSIMDSSKRLGLWRIIVVHNVPYTDARRNGKVPKLLLHRIFPNVRYSIWIDGKLELVMDPYQILERFLWRQNASFAISRHYTRFDVFEEAEANKAAGKYDNSSIDYQIEFYKNEGLTPYSEAKLPITSDVPEGCVIIREHIPITNLFTCLWFNEVDRFTSRDQLSFSTVRDKIMEKVDWSIDMFLDCERRNFVVQAYHRDVLEHMPPPVPVRHPPPAPARHPPLALPKDNKAGRGSVKKNLPKRGKADKRSISRRHRKVSAGSKDTNNSMKSFFLPI